jgi:hypothetical protein
MKKRGLEISWELLGPFTAVIFGLVNSSFHVGDSYHKQELKAI